MRPPRLNERTLDLLYESSIANLPERERWLDVDPNEIDDRYVVVGEDFVWDDDQVTLRFGGCWPTLTDAEQSYDENAGIPAYVIDIFSEPESAIAKVVRSWRTDRAWFGLPGFIA